MIDLKDHVEHLRTIHFAVIGSCAALLIAVQFLPGIEWHDAQAQIKRLAASDKPLMKNLSNEKIKELERGVIRDVIKCYEKDTDRIIPEPDKCTSTFRPPTMGVGDYPFKDFWHVRIPEKTNPVEIPEGSAYKANIRIEDDGALCCLRFDFGSRGTFLTKVKFEPPVVQGFSSAGDIPAPPEKPTLKDYQMQWEKFTENNIIHIPWRLEPSFDESSGSDFSNAAIESVVVGSVTNTIRLLRVTTRPQEEIIYETNELSAHLNDLPNPVRVKMKLQERRVNVDPGLWVTRDNRHRERHANLMFIATVRNLMNDTFQEAQEKIDNEIKIRTESFSVLGLEIPSELLLNWGVVIVVTLQLYLLMHLRSYCKLLSGHPTYEVAWIGYYADLLSKTIFTLTTLVLPVITVIILVSQLIRHPNFTYFVPALALIVVSASVSYLTRTSMRELWKKIRNSK